MMVKMNFLENDEMFLFPPFDQFLLGGEKQDLHMTSYLCTNKALERKKEEKRTKKKHAEKFLALGLYQSFVCEVKDEWFTCNTHVREGYSLFFSFERKRVWPMGLFLFFPFQAFAGLEGAFVVFLVGSFWGLRIGFRVDLRLGFLLSQKQKKNLLLFLSNFELPLFFSFLFFLFFFVQTYKLKFKLLIK